MFMPQKVGYTEKVGMDLADGLLFPYDLSAASPSETHLLRENPSLALSILLNALRLLLLSLN